MPNPDQSEKIAFDYAWNYFSLHAGQRMQSVNFFLLAASFLVGAYVAALGGNRPGLGAGISIVGAITSFVFYRIERRVRELLKAAEAALSPIEARLASETANPSLRILERAEKMAPDAWKYSKGFGILYAAVGIAFIAATIYAAGTQAALTPNPTTIFPLVLRLACGTILLLFGFENISTAGEQHKKLEAHWFTWIMPLLGAVAAVTGIVVLFRLGFWGI
jgi:hypothetical protein